MKNNKVGKIAIAEAGHKRSRFNLSHDVNTTASFGDLQPIGCQYMVANSKMTRKNESLLRAAPMPRPTVGRIDYKTWDMFVPVDEVFPNFDAMMARSTISRVGEGGSHTFVPQSMPYITPKKLSLLCLLGASCAVWCSKSDSEYEPTTLDHIIGWLSYTDYHDSTLANNLRNLEMDWFQSGKLPAFDYSGYYFNAGILFSEIFGGHTNGIDLKIPCGTPPFLMPKIQLDTADFVIISNMFPAEQLDSHPRSVALAFRLSSYGMRMFKLLTGLGYPISFEDDTTKLDITRLLAWYRGYYELFGLNLYENFEVSACSKLIQYITNNNHTDVGNFDVHIPSSVNYTNTAGILWDFFRELGNCYVTQDVDYVSQHIATAGIGASSGQALNQSATDFLNSNAFIDTSSAQINSRFMLTEGDTAAATGVHYGAFVAHGPLDEQMLKIFYRWTNRQTIAGQDIEKNLRALGLGHYVDEIKVDFIGYNTQRLSLAEVCATSDTSSVAGDSGAYLGEFGGKSVTYNGGKVLSWETKKAGYWLTYAAVVPESGYCQAFDPITLATNPFEIYTPELDSRGYEATTKAELFGYGQISSRQEDIGKPNELFGFRPRFMQYKTSRNIANGDFSLHSKREQYLPFILDKILPVNERIVIPTSGSNSYRDEVLWERQLDFNTIPVAGNIWRFAYRYGFLGDLNRMFVNDKDTEPAMSWEAAKSFLDNTRWLYASYFADNWIVHNEVMLNYYAPMLPLGASYGTSDDEAPANASIDKS